MIDSELNLATSWAEIGPAWNTEANFVVQLSERVASSRDTTDPVVSVRSSTGDQNTVEIILCNVPRIWCD
jgi:hypothetical protein